MKIAVIGSGSWGTAIAVLLAKKGYDVYLWSWKEEESAALCRDRENREFLPGIMLPDNIICTNVMADCTEGAEVIVCASPSVATRNIAKALSGCTKEGQIIVNIAKGLEESTLMRLSQVFKDEIPHAKIAVMSGPSHAEEVSRNLPTTNVVAAEDMQVAKKIQDIFMQDTFRIYTSDDVVGVEIGGALKNVIALCAGICDGLGYGDNTKAALMTRGIAEITRLGVSMGAKRDTFAGLSGIGDLIVTCTSMHSRNRRAGILLGKGKSLDETLKEIHMVVEGVNTAAAALALSKKYGAVMPITEEANKILFEGKDPGSAVLDLMTRDRKAE